jgi:general secretion pathway protein K
VRRDRPPHERGAALLSVLLLVAVMAVIAAVMLDRLNLATRLAGNGQAMTQARLRHQRGNGGNGPAQGAGRCGRSPHGRPHRLLGREFPLPLPRGAARVRIDDAGNCFNVNSLVQQGVDGTFTLRPVALTQLRALMAGWLCRRTRRSA